MQNIVMCFVSPRRLSDVSYPFSGR